jgi:hypothetical protein
MKHRIQFTLDLDDQGLRKLLVFLQGESIPVDLKRLPGENDNANRGSRDSYTHGFDPDVDC